MSHWAHDSYWFQPALGIDGVAARLGIQPSSVRRYLTDPHTDFPAPADQQANRNLWTPTSTFRYLWNTKPSQRQRIPRLCPLVDDLPPARMLDRYIAEIWGGHTYAVHIWEPGDGRGPVAIAYPKDLSATTIEAARQLLAQRPYLTALALSRNIPGRYDPSQPRILVADRDGEEGWYPYHAVWSDLSALLQTDLPWWSHGLTDVVEMTNWYPSAPLAHVRPHAGDFTGESFAQCRPHDGSDADRALAALEGSTDRALAEAFGIWPDGYDHRFPNRPGFTHAAAAVLNPQSPAVADPATISAALRHQVHNRDLAVRAVNTARGFDVLHPAITHELLTIDGRDCSPLAHEWLDRLIDVGAQHQDELGYHWVVTSLPAEPAHWWRDELNPALWAVTDTDGITHATLGTAMPAQGRIEQLAIQDRCPFFRDSTGAVFPLPSTTGSPHQTAGFGATDLTASVLVLLNNAGASLYGGVAFRADIYDTQATGLYEVIANSTSPIVLSRSDLDELVQETAAGIARRQALQAEDAEIASFNART